MADARPIDPNRAGGPTVTRIVLGTQLRRLREAAGITRHAAGDAIRASHAKISRLELGRVGFKERDIADLLTLYDVTDEKERAAYLTLAAKANTRGWWQHDTDLLPGWFELYLRLEQEATFIRTFELQFVPGLLQSEEYARALIEAGHNEEPAYEIDRRVNLRLTRQKMLTQPKAPRVWAVLDESVVCRRVGSRGIMRAQLEHLLTMADLPNVTVQVLPFNVLSHASAGSFTLLRFAESDLPDIVYLEQLNSSAYLDKRAEVEDYLAVMERVCVEAATPRRTKDILRALAAEL